jgi:uncharacterized protein
MFKIQPLRGPRLAPFTGELRQIPLDMFPEKLTRRAYLAPFVAFMALLALSQMVGHFFEGLAWWAVAKPIYWAFPLQTVLCGALLFAHWKVYQLRPPVQIGFTLAIALGVVLLWIAPQELLGFASRTAGFEPHFFGTQGWPYWLNLGTRFVRLVIVVPLLEEIFWRGFLLRYLIGENFTQVPFGQFQWGSFGAVSLCFALAHAGPDFVPALLTGALYNWIACRTRSLSSCVLAHALTNLLLGFYILKTGQWGFW